MLSHFFQCHLLTPAVEEYGQVGFIISASITYNRSKSGRGRIKNKWAAALAHTSNVKVDYFRGRGVAQRNKYIRRGKKPKAQR